MTIKRTIGLIIFQLTISTVTAADAADGWKIGDSEGDIYERSKITHRFRDAAVGSRYRNEHRRMDICKVFEKDLAAAESRYYNYESAAKGINNAIRAQQKKVDTKKKALTAKQTKFDKANGEVVRLEDLRVRKPQLLKKHGDTIVAVDAKLPQAQQVYDEAARRKKKRCDWRGDLRGSCREAKRDKDKAEKKLKALRASKADAQAAIAELGKVDIVLAAAKRILENAQRALSREQKSKPSLTTLRQKLNGLKAKREAEYAGFQDIEAEYALAAIRTEKCRETQYEARKAKSFKRALLAFARDNGAGCAEAVSLIGRTRGYAAKEGVQEAYELFCESHALVVYRDAPPDDRYHDPVGAPSQRERFIAYPRVSRNAHNLDGVSNAMVFSYQGAREIKLDISGYDIEHKYDYLLIENREGREIAKWSNRRKGQPVRETVSTGWVEGDTLVLRYITDKMTLGKGFSIDGFYIRD